MKQIYLLIYVPGNFLKENNIKLKDYEGSYLSVYTADKAQIASLMKTLECRVFTFPEMKEIKECEIVLD